MLYNCKCTVRDKKKKLISRKRRKCCQAEDMRNSRVRSRTKQKLYQMKSFVAEWYNNRTQIPPFYFVILRHNTLLYKFRPYSMADPLSSECLVKKTKVYNMLRGHNVEARLILLCLFPLFPLLVLYRAALRF